MQRKLAIYENVSRNNDKLAWLTVSYTVQFMAQKVRELTSVSTDCLGVVLDIINKLARINSKGYDSNIPVLLYEVSLLGADPHLIKMLDRL